MLLMVGFLTISARVISHRVCGSRFMQFVLVVGLVPNRQAGGGVEAKKHQ